MINSRVKQLMESIRSKEFHNSTYTKSNQTQTEAISKLKSLQQSYDHLLSESLTMLELLDQTMLQTSHQYDMLSEELEREKKDRQIEVGELEVLNMSIQKSISTCDNKLREFRRIITDKQEEIFTLKSEMEEKEGQLVQFEIDTRQNIKKMIDEHSSKLTDELDMQKNELSLQFAKTIKKLQSQNEAYLHENQILSLRLEQIMKHVQETQNQDSVNYRITPQIISHNFQQSTNKKIGSPFSPNIYSISRQTSPEKSCEFQGKDQQDSSQSCSSNRMILREILNTEDRISDNFGSINFYSKDRQYLLASNDENNYNQGNIQVKTQQKVGPDQPLQATQEFKTDETHICPDPYHIFFTLISQCAKIDSQNMEAAALIDLSRQWTYLTANKIPLHEWHSTLITRISEKICTL